MPTSKKFLIIVAIIVTSFVVVSGYLQTPVAAQAAKYNGWAMKDCYTLDDVTAFLNSLPADKADDAKVLAINSQRSMLGALSNPYYVWYRR